MSELLHRRVRQIRARAERRRWAYRQRNLAQGVWFRIARVLVEAAEAWAISDEDAAALAAEGIAAEPAGLEVEPPLALRFVPAERLAGLASRRPLDVRLSAELLSARNVALVRFGASSPR